MPAVTDWQEVDEGIWVRRYQPYQVNVTAIDVGAGIVLVDTRGSVAEAREVAQDLGTVSKLPVVAVVNTHEHLDHVLGNGMFADLPRFGHVRCAESLERSGEQQRSSSLSWLPEEVHQEVLESPILPPDRTFERSTTLDIGDREVTLTHLGRGHTDNDVIVEVAESDVLLAGDLVEEGASPAFGDAFPFAWPDTVAALLERVRGPVVPGHGDVVDRDFVATQQRELAGVAALARAHLEQGRPANELLDGGPYSREVMEQAFDRARVELGGR